MSSLLVRRSLPALVFCLPLLGPVGCGSADSESAHEHTHTPQPGDPAFVRDPALNVENVSRAGEERSHNEGENCMHCHQPHGAGLGLFSLAGTLYGPDGRPYVGGAEVRVTTGPFGDGEVLTTVEVDDLGNFFTTAELPFPEQAVFPFATSLDGTLAVGMPFPTISGACNVCHAGAARVTLAPVGGGG